MSPLTLLAVIGASFLALTTAQETETGPTYTVTLGKDGECLAAVNAARQAVGFSQLIQAGTADTEKRLPAEVTSKKESDDDWAWKPVCKSLIPTTEKSGGTAGSAEQAEFQSGTYAYHVVDNPEAVDCTAIVNKWKDCRVVTCTKTTPAATSFRATRDTENKEETGYALICMTVPDVLRKEADKAPFTEEQWGQIVTAIEGSASAVMPGVVSLVLVILGLSML
ncbi:SAG family member [Eimeria mitis]|uniref:SAG family member n=1 Tax=Eimeria mitis TaxID=44415 RepID=U6KAK4_9EIME|nr:SAG family member [Eimeria mitis]CDJ33252.1 SAG family member [Eimeria mitis]